MTQRILAAIVGLGVLIPTLWFGGTLAVDLVVFAATMVCLTEYVGMAFPEDRNVAMGWMAIGMSAIYSTAWYVDMALVGWVGAMVTMATFMFVTLRPGESLEAAADAVGRYVLGFAWIGFLTFIPLLRRLDSGLAWLTLVLVISWCGDTGGYFSGRFLGKNKLYPRVSPKKTWEGVAGGIALSIVGVFALRTWALPVLNPVDCVVLGVLLTAAGVLGDLAESLLKRAFHVKDSGWIMPGHGGLLDRVDSVLFVAPLVYGYAVLLKG